MGGETVQKVTEVLDKAYHSRVREFKKAFQCTHTMGVPAPFLHRESTDSLIYTVCVMVG